jgi:hypothetical protein
MSLGRFPYIHPKFKKVVFLPFPKLPEVHAMKISMLVSLQGTSIPI